MGLIPRRPPFHGDEKETLVGLLDLNRAMLVWKLEGLTDDQARERHVGSLTTLLGLVKHMAYVESWWFLEYIDGRQELELTFDREDEDADFRLGLDETIASVIDLYERQVAAANEAIAAHELDDVGGELRGGTRSLRWVLGHMIEETARHLGHADIIRELIDGTTGYMPQLED